MHLATVNTQKGYCTAIPQEYRNSYLQFSFVCSFANYHFCTGEAVLKITVKVPVSGHLREGEKKVSAIGAGCLQECVKLIQELEFK